VTPPGIDPEGVARFVDLIRAAPRARLGREELWAAFAARVSGPSAGSGGAALASRRSASGRVERSLPRLLIRGPGLVKVAYVLGDIDWPGLRIARGAARVAAEVGLPAVWQLPGGHQVMQEAATALGAATGWPAETEPEWGQGVPETDGGDRDPDLVPDGVNLPGDRRRLRGGIDGRLL
jgi:hypothetical protein